jgi:raffinose/stachyose/melibiose transport system permease protein
MTQGGPGDTTRTIPIYMILTAFDFGEFGYAACMGIILTVVVIFCTLITTRIFGGEDYEF